MAKIICVPFNAICELKEFKINDISADYNNFGTKEDIDEDNTEDYCCGDMRFIPKPAEQCVLKKYHINVEEYTKVCEILECLSFGKCDMCR